MPRIASNNKQKNKKFKGTSKHAKQAHIKPKTKAKTKTKTKGIAKIKTTKISKLQRLKEHKSKKQKQVEKLAVVNQYLDQRTKSTVKEKMKEQNQIRIVLLVPCNQSADVVEVMNRFLGFANQEGFAVRNDLKTCTAFPAMQIFPAHRSMIRNKLFFIACQRNPQQLLDMAKCADIVCPVLSVLSANPQKIVQDPSNYAGAFDEFGYTAINMLRSLGLPRITGIIQHSQKIHSKHSQKICKFYKRFFTSQFGQQKLVNLQTNTEISTLYRIYDSCGLIQQPWKKDRGYILADQIQLTSQGNIAISGFVKGSCINPNQIVHITGIDDYQIEKIQILNMGAKSKMTMEIQNNQELVQYQTVPQDLNPFSKPQVQDQDILAAIKDLQINQQQHNIKQDDQMNEQHLQQQQEQEWQDEQISLQQFQKNKLEQKKVRVEMQMRKQDEMQFEDEVEYAAQDILRDNYRQYQGLKSFKTSSWNKLQNLPSQYDRIYFFKNYHQTHTAAIKDNLARGFAYPGFYVKVTIKDIKPEHITNIGNMPLILSFLLKHQRKMTVLHGKVQKNAYYQGQNNVNSNELVMISLGFKKILVEPIYSRLINGSQKTKYTKYIGQDYQNHYYCSFYHYNYFPSSPFLVFRVNRFNTNEIQPEPILRGQLSKCDPMHVILQRIIFTGYPYKINRRRATVRYMFFNPSDVKYFKPVQIRTRLGLRGKIQQSLGTHGLMKCFFNDPIKQNDTICMNLYRRIYPQSNF